MEVSLPAPSSATSRKKSGNGMHCHQCRQPRDIVAPCKNQPCAKRICNKCLLNRYGEKIEEVATNEQWSCPTCRGICNCSICMKRKGHQPTGILSSAVKAAGFSSVSEMLLKSADRTNNENDSADMTADLEKGVDFSSINKGKENAFAGKLDANFQNSEENQKKRKRGQLGETNNSNADKQSEKKKRKKPRREGLDGNADCLHQQNAEIVLPVGTDLTNVADIDMRAEDIGNALQFLEFCFVFEKILDMKKGEAECILEDVLQSQPVLRGRSSLTVQFHMRLLSIIPTDQGEKCTTYGLWFNTLKKCLSESKHISNEPVVVSLEKAADYEALSATEKLKVLTLLCDEVLGTEKVRKWIDHQNTIFQEKAKEAKQELLNAKKKDTIVSCRKSEAAQAHEHSLELKGLRSKGKPECDAMRIKPIVIEHSGRVYWKLNCCKDDVVHQNVGKGNNLALDEKWFILDNEGKETMEKYFGSACPSLELGS
ncbi:hypothetical protein ACS0TY_029040 [Phlomoides rotata]